MSASTRPSTIPPANASTARMIVFFAATVMISGNRSLKISGSKKVSWSFAQSALRAIRTSARTVNA